MCGALFTADAPQADIRGHRPDPPESDVLGGPYQSSLSSGSGLIWTTAVVGSVLCGLGCGRPGGEERGVHRKLCACVMCLSHPLR